VYDTSGRIHSWNLTGHIPRFDSTRPRSDLHIRARALIKAEYPTDNILEEVPLPGEQLYGDFYLPLRRLMVEAMGEQHYNYIPFFHGSPFNFIKGKKNDARKREWCLINDIQLIEFKYNEKEEEWLMKLRQ
jgi:hypothetical protein